MKRLVWLFLALFCTALAQVQPVSLPDSDPATAPCSCCEIPGDCGMPDCALPPAHAPVTFAAEQPARLVVREARRAALPVRRNTVRFYAPFVPLAAAPASPASLLPTAFTLSAAPVVPLFKAHCRFLI